MRSLAPARVLLGALVWGTAALSCAVTLLSPGGAARGPARRLWRYAVTPSLRLRLRLPPGAAIEAGDGVFREDERRFLVRIGTVAAVERTGGGRWVRVVVHPEEAAFLARGVSARAFSVPETAAWVVRTLLPPETLREIRTLAARELAAEGGAIRDLLWPEVRAALGEVLDHLRRALPAAIARRSEGWRSVLARHRRGALASRLFPALEEIVWPLARERFRPLLERVGEELWAKLPMWSLGWRAVAEKLPFTDKEQVKRRFEEYLAKDAAPILRAHAGEAAALAGEVLREALADRRVAEGLGAVLEEMAGDPEVGRLLGELAGEWNREEGLGEILRRRWKAGLGEAVSAAVTRLDPLFRRVVDRIALDARGEGINPRLAFVLRARVFGKDRRWLLLVPEGEDG